MLSMHTHKKIIIILIEYLMQKLYIYIYVCMYVYICTHYEVWIEVSIYPQSGEVLPLTIITTSQEGIVIQNVCYSSQIFINFRTSSSDGKESSCKIRDPGSIQELGYSPGEGNSNSLHYSCLENSVDRGPWRATVHEVTKSQK